MLGGSFGWDFQHLVTGATSTSEAIHGVSVCSSPINLRMYKYEDLKA